MMNWWKRHTETKEDREEMVLLIILWFLILVPCLSLLALGIQLFVKYPVQGTQVVGAIVTGIVINVLIDKWIKRGK